MENRQLQSFSQNSLSHQQKQSLCIPNLAIKDDTNISDGEDESLSRGRVNSMRTNIRDLGGSITDTKFRDLSIIGTKELSLKNSSIAGLKHLTSSQNLYFLFVNKSKHKGRIHNIITRLKPSLRIISSLGNQ